MSGAGQQYRAAFAYMDQIVRGERIAAFRDPPCRATFRPKAENDPASDTPALVFR